jgi:glucose-6-phosphate isomerase
MSAVGLFPLGLANFDITGFWAGAGEMSKRCTERDVHKNPALASAILTHVNYGKGFNIYNSFYFNPELKSLGKWYTQLMAESIAKDLNLDGERVNVGITPIVSIGSIDLHSMATLFLGEPKNKFTQFIHAGQTDNSLAVPKDLFLPGLVDDIAGKSIADIMGAIFYGVKIAYLKNALPYSEIVMHEISEHTLGQYLQLKMCETMYLARLFGVNAFDQPRVEDYKRETREILKKL